MKDLWLKIKIWTKLLALGFLVVYAFLLYWKNAGGAANVDFWYWFNCRWTTTPLSLVLASFLAGAILALLARTFFVTIRQLKQAREAAKTAQMQKDLADMKAKAGMLQTKDEPKKD